MTPTTAELCGQPALETSAPHAWSGLPVERYQLEATMLPAHFHAQHLLIPHQGSQPVRSSRRQGSQVEEGSFGYGEAGLREVIVER
jgi:AraC family transcriptional regulator